MVLSESMSLAMVSMAHPPQSAKDSAGRAAVAAPDLKVPYTSQLLPLMWMRLTLACAFAFFGSVTVRTPFLKAAFTLSFSTS